MAKQDNAADRNWLAHCGNYCGDCLLYHGEITDLAKVLLRRLKRMEHDHSAHHAPQLPQNDVYQQYCHRLYEALYSIDLLCCTQVCREGGGSETCKIRECCIERGLAGCWDCDDLTRCALLSEIDPAYFEEKMRTLLEIRENGVERFLKHVHQRRKPDSIRKCDSRQPCKSH